MRRTRVGHQTHFQADDESPLFEELRGIILKTVGLAELLRQALKPLRSKIAAAFVYGSVAKKMDRAGSDIDLLVISDDLLHGELFGSLERVAKSLGRSINPTVYTPAEFRRRLRERNAFVTRVLEGPRLWVFGSDDDLPSGS